MTVNTANITSGPYAGDDITSAFDYDFRIEDKTQLIVYETDDTGVQTTLTVDTDYTVSGIGVDAGGQVTRVAGALPTGYEWYIRSNYQATQDTAFASQGGFFPDVHEAAFDKLTFLIQQLSDGKDRTFKLADSLDVDGDFALVATAAERAGMYLTFDSNGDIAVTTSPQVLTVDGIYDNVSLMRTASLSTGLMIMTRGYTTAGDGGWAVYYIKPPQAFDNIIDHELANGNVAVLQRLSADNVSNTAAGIITSTIQQDVNDELAGFISTLQTYTAQDLIANTTTHDMTSDADYNLTSTENLKGRVIITDTGVVLTTGQNIVVANTARFFLVLNSTAQTLTFKTAAGAGIAVLAGESAVLLCDGTDVINAMSDFYTKTEIDSMGLLLHVQDQKTSGTNGGNSIAGVQTRNINTVLTNEIPGASLSSNQITLPAGTYEVDASAPAWGAAASQVYLYDATNTTTLVVGTTEFTSGGSPLAQTRSFVKGRFTLAGTASLMLRHYTGSVNTNGLGVAASSGQGEVYSDVQIRTVS